MGLMKTLYKKDRYTNFYVGLSLPPISEGLAKKTVSKQQDFSTALDSPVVNKVPFKKTVDKLEVLKNTESNRESQDVKMFENLLIQDLIRNG